MPTAKPRFNVTLETKTAALIKHMARREKKTVASMTRDLLLEGIASMEEIPLLRLAESREKEDAGKKRLSRKELWS